VLGSEGCGLFLGPLPDLFQGKLERTHTERVGRNYRETIALRLSARRKGNLNPERMGNSYKRKNQD